MKYLSASLSTALLLTLIAFGNSGCSSDKADAKNDSKTVKNDDATPGFTTFETAFAQAKDTKKMVLVDVYTDWCVWCKRMDHDTYPDPKVQAELTKYFTAAKLNAESTTMRTFKGALNSEQQIASHWGVTGYPTLVFMTADGEVVQTIPGYVPPAEFPYVLKFFGSGAYQTTQDYQAWKKAQS